MRVPVRPARRGDAPRTCKNRAAARAAAAARGDLPESPDEHSWLPAVPALTDLDAGPSLAEKAYVDSLPPECILARAPADPWTARATGADGRRLRVDGKVCIALHIGHRIVPTWFHVVRDLVVEILFGTDNLYLWGAMIDVCAGRVWLQNLQVTLRGPVLTTHVAADPVAAALARRQRTGCKNTYSTSTPRG